MDENTRINKCEEFVSKCPHRRKFKLGRCKDADDVDLLRCTVVPDSENTNFECGNLTQLRRGTRQREKSKRYGEDWTT